MKDIEVKEGQEVEKGAKLFSYDNEEINLQMKQAELDQKMADMRYDRGRRKLIRLRKKLRRQKIAELGKK